VETVGGTLRIARGARLHRVTLAGRTVLEDRESGTVAIVAREPKEGPPASCCSSWAREAAAAPRSIACST
jgi:hypothetical protein